MTDETDDRLILLSPQDNVFVTRAPIAGGERILISGQKVVVATALSLGHKLARRAISPGEKVLKYGASIGSATAQIQPGEHVHLHNLKSDYTATHSLQSAKERHLGETQGDEE